MDALGIDSRCRNWSVSAAFLLIFLTNTIISSPAITQVKTAARASTCKISQLSATEDLKESDGIEGGLGHHAMTIAIQNRSSASCVLYGVPTFTLSYSANRPFSLQVCSNCDDYLFDKQPVTEILLEPKKSGYVVVGYNINDGNGQLQCTEPNTVMALSLYLSNQREPLRIRIAGLRICGAINVTPFLSKPPVDGSLPRH